MSWFSSLPVAEAPSPAALAWAPVDLREVIAAAMAAVAPQAEEVAEEREPEIDPEALAAAAREEERLQEIAAWEARIAEAYRRGFEEGREEGEIAEQARLRSAVRASEEALEELRLGEMRWTGTIEENVCALAVVVARQVIGRELADDSQPVVELVRSALAEFPIDQPMRIRVNPSDLSSISRATADGRDPLLSLTRDRDARWLPDPVIAPGGCVVEGRERIIDGRVDVALERVYRRLTYTNA
jgi:flagellar assembly protein FliH